MQSPAIQAALDNLVETVRTSLMAEFLELLRSGKPAPRPGQASKRKKKAAPKSVKKRASTASKKKVAKR